MCDARSFGYSSQTVAADMVTSYCRQGWVALTLQQARADRAYFSASIPDLQVWPIIKRVITETVDPGLRGADDDVLHQYVTANLNTLRRFLSDALRDTEVHVQLMPSTGPGRKAVSATAVFVSSDSRRRGAVTRITNALFSLQKLITDLRSLRNPGVASITYEVGAEWSPFEDAPLLIADALHNNGYSVQVGAAETGVLTVKS
jgi:hypothetical protein